MKLLLAEDEHDLSDAIAKVLRSKNYDVECAFDGQEALDKIYENTYDALILDVMMPKKDGFAVVKELRSQDNYIPILILTAITDIDDKVSLLDSGADDYLTKPFSFKELLARIRALLRRSGGKVKDAYQIGETKLDHETFELSCKGKLRLTATEYKMMEYLIRNHNSLVSTEKLMDAIWDYDSDAEINVVWAYISSLRKKLEQIGSDYTIKAVRGVGYQLYPRSGIKPSEE
ncbi:MAG: response regulator transcription factor [Eubacteriales bacterium]|jgi:DNA-binding response OmpR family regulator|nr:response regulator transcription factor [Eubacteriales bacterium]